jgi:hypothetical protein
VLTDEKSGQNVLRSIFNPTHHFVNLCLDILAVRMAFVRKRCGGKFGWPVLVDSSPTLITLRYSKTLTT